MGRGEKNDERTAQIWPVFIRTLCKVLLSSVTEIHSRKGLTDDSILLCHCQIDIGIFEDERRRLAAEFQRYPLQIALCGGFLDFATRASTAGKGDLSDFEVCCQQVSGFACPIDDVNRARRETLFDQWPQR